MDSKKWFQAVLDCQNKKTNYALVTVLGCTGSTPRDQLSKMVVTLQESFDSVGGGNLEYQSIDQARGLLRKKQFDEPKVVNFPLGASLGQCCGGSATVLIEVFELETMHVCVFGAGHVAHALMPILQALPYKLTWIDQREYLFDSLNLDHSMELIVDENPAEIVQDLENPDAILVLTHNHQLDFEICKQVLQFHPDSFLGVIGSQTKANRFRHKLKQQQFEQYQIEQMVCPVGLDQVPGKLPMQVAVSISAQIISLAFEKIKLNQNNSLVNQYKQRGLSHKKLLPLLSENK